MMKWLMTVILCAGVFVAGALYGIEKNTEKYNESDAVAHEHNEESLEGCTPPKVEEDMPISVKVAASFGEGVAIGFDMVVLLFSEFTKPDSV